MSALLTDLFGILRRGTQWWSGELASLVPTGLKRQQGQGQLDAIVAVAADGSARLVTEGTRARGAKLAGQDVWDYLARLGRTRASPKVGLRLSNSACYARRIEIPADARQQAGAILALDLERATPFKTNDVYTSHYVVPASGRKGWLWAYQLVTKRAYADKWIAEIEAAGARVARLDCWGEDEKTPILVDFLSSNTSGSAPGTSGRRRTLLFAIVAGLLGLSATAIAIGRHEAALQTLEAKVTSARVEAKASRQKRDELEAAGAQSAAMRNFRMSRPATVDIIEELTRLLPDGVSLSDLKIDGDTVEISGFAKPAASVIPILERSEMFKDAALTAPVTFDSTENKERFSLRLKFRKGGQAAAAKPEEAAP